MTKKYCGRFAPTPSGALHFGSLTTALGSYLEAKTQHGEWLVRIDDLDPPREQAGARDDILRTLERFGFEWDREILRQRWRNDAYEHALETLKYQARTYACQCSRKQIQQDGTRLKNGAWQYAGTCRHAHLNDPKLAWRFIVLDEMCSFHDRIQGWQTQNLAHTSGDFVIKRADGIFAYALAVVVDDAFQGITHVVRGADLCELTLQQIALQQALNLPTPDYAHLPIMQNHRGEKLSKQTLAPTISNQAPLKTLLHAMRIFGFSPTQEYTNLEEFWTWATSVWNIQTISPTPKTIEE